MEKKFCDRCGKPIETTEYKVISTGYDDSVNILCNECVEDFNKFMSGENMVGPVEKYITKSFTEEQYKGLMKVLNPGSIY